VKTDTSPDALHAQTEALRRLGGSERFRTACMMSQALREMAIARIRDAHPELDDRGVIAELLFELYGFRNNA
jgi:hypothetical protein